MPLIRSITALADGFTVVTSNGVSHTFNGANLTPAQKLMTPAQIEALAAPLIANFLQGAEFFGLHLTSVVPLQRAAIVSDDPLPDGWWL